MYDPREDPILDDPVARIRAFARDLAYGALVGDWNAEFFKDSYGEMSAKWRVDGSSEKFDSFLSNRWKDSPPAISLLESFNFVILVREESFAPWATSGPTSVVVNKYLLTEKAFQLLEQPRPASVFISYRRSQSSAFALLILARMKAVGLSPFLDMQDLAPGEEWHARLEAEIAQRDYCLTLINCDTLKSEYVRREIQWALNVQKTVIPVWHGGMNGEVAKAVQDTYPALTPFFTKQAIVVEPETPAGYESAIVQLLNRFGYTP